MSASSSCKVLADVACKLAVQQSVKRLLKAEAVLLLVLLGGFGAQQSADWLTLHAELWCCLALTGCIADKT